MEKNQKMQIPEIGLGTHRIDEKEGMEKVLERAWKCGYRMFDTAQGYGNEQQIGTALDQLQVKRSEYFLISKLDDIYRDETSVRESVQRSLEALKTDYIDLFLIHSPNSVRMKEMARKQGIQDDTYWEDMNRKAMKVMVELKKEGIFKRIGVSNFNISHLRSLMNSSIEIPEVNQIKMCIGSRGAQENLLRMCAKEHITIMGYSPLGKGIALSHPLILELGGKYEKKPAQIVLNSLRIKGVIPIVRAASQVHMEQNLASFDFTMEMKDVNRLDKILINENWAMIKNPDTQEKYNEERMDGDAPFLS